MKFGPWCDAPSAAALELAVLDAALSPSGEYGRRSAARLRPYAPGQEAEARARAGAVARFAQAAGAERLDAAVEIAGRLPDVASALARAALGDVLDDPQWLELQRFCDGLARIDQAFSGVDGYASLNTGAPAQLGAFLEPGRSGKHGFYLADAFEPGLSAAREAARVAQQAYDACAARDVERIGAALERDDLNEGEFTIVRSTGAALPAGVRVVREAPGYWLCVPEWSEPTYQALTERERATRDVARYEERARARMSAVLRELAPALEAAATRLGEFDVLVAAAVFTLSHDCVPADIVPDAELSFEAGRFLPLERELRANGRAFVPISLDLRSDVAVLTGPNMGGKSACLRTCGFIAACAAFGLPVPARRARVGLFDEIVWLGIGGDERLGGLLSSFAKEVVRLRDVLARDRRRPLVLIDEFARTTTPAEAKALLVSLLERLRASGACGLAATHLAGVAQAAGVRHFAIRGLRGAGVAEVPAMAGPGDLQAALTALAAAMDYGVIEVGSDGPSQADALALARLLGLDEALIARAHSYLGR